MIVGKVVRQVAGVFSLAVGVLANPWMLEQYVILDGRLNDKLRVIAGDAVLVVIGALLLWSASRVNDVPDPRAGRKALFAAIAVGFASLFALGVAEVVLRMAVSPLTVLDGELRGRQLFKQMQATKQGGGQLAYTYDKYDPELGWVPIPNYDHEDIQTNSRGMRGKREYAFERTQGVERIVVVGDSYTWGEQTWHEKVLSDQTYCAVLERRRKNTEVLNMGVHGWGTDQQLIYLKRLGLKFSPDVVILGFYEENMLRNGLGFFGFAKPWFELQNGELQLRGTPVPTLQQVLAEPVQMPSFYLGALVKKNLDYVLDKTQFRPVGERMAWKRTAVIFDAARAATHAAGAKFVLLYIPFSASLYPSGIEVEVAKWAKRSGSHWINMREVFSRRPAEEWPSLYDGHWSPRGHELAAEAIDTYLEDNGLL